MGDLIQEQLTNGSTGLMNALTRLLRRNHIGDENIFLSLESILHSHG